VSALPLFSSVPRITRDEIQAEMIDAIEAVRLSGRPSTILQSSTGTGKTHVAAKWIIKGRERGARFLFLAHRDILINQAAERFRDFGISYVVEQAGRKALGIFRSPLLRTEVVIGSKDSLQRDRLDAWPRDAFTDIITDECHLASARTYANVYEHFTGARFHLGLSATPFRADGTPLYGTPGSLFGDGAKRAAMELEGLPLGTEVHDAVAFKYPLPAAIKNGHLADVVFVPCNVGIDVRGIRTVGRGRTKDFNTGDLSDRLSPMISSLANVTRHHLDRLNIRKAVGFAPDVKAAQALAAGLRQVGVPAEAVWTGSRANPLTDAEKASILRRYEEGATRVLVSVDLLTTGWDSPRTQAVILYRMTMSLGLAMQMIGRCTRILPGKATCYALGFEWEGAEGAVGTLDVMMEDEPDPKVRAKAQAKARAKKSDYSVMDLLDEAREEAKREAEAEAKKAAVRVKAKRQDVKHRYKEFRPWNVGEIVGVEVLPDRKAAKLDPPTPQQVQVLAEYGIRSVSGLDRSTCEKILNECMDRDLYRKADPVTLRKLLAAGVDLATARSFTAAEAAKVLAQHDRPSGRLWGWLRMQGYRDEVIERMSRSEAGRIYAMAKRRAMA
jgi:superfamily II DNA or RNA helicase